MSDLINRTVTLAFLQGLISDDTEREKAVEYISGLPSAEKTGDLNIFEGTIESALYNISDVDNYSKGIRNTLRWILWCIRDDEEPEYETIVDYEECSKEHKQLAEWLKDYKRLLSVENTEDLISRQAVNELVDELARAISDERSFISRGRDTATIMQDILDLPSAEIIDKHIENYERKEKDDTD